MKKLLLLTFLLFTFSITNAEYNGWFIKFLLEKTDGTKINGHMYITSGYFEQDSIHNNNYVINRLNLLDQNNNSSVIQFYKNRIAYKYYPYNGNEPDTTYSLINETQISVRKIKKIKITEMTEHTYAVGIRNKLTLKDTIWMKTKPVKLEFAYIYLCDYQLFFHEFNTELANLIAQLKKIQPDTDPNNIDSEAETESESINLENSEIEKQILFIIDKIK